MITEIKENEILCSAEEQVDECFFRIPTEILFDVFKNLKQEELAKVSLVCWNWKKIIDEIQIKSMDHFVNNLEKKNIHYFDCYIKYPLEHLTFEKNLRLRREILIIGLINLRIESKFKARHLNTYYDDMIRKILRISRYGFKLVVSLKCFSNKAESVNQDPRLVGKSICELCEYLIKKGETSTIFSILNFFADLNEYQVLEVYKKILQKIKDLDEALEMLSFIKNISIQREMLMFILMNPPEILSAERCITIINEQLKVKLERYKFFETICQNFEEENKSDFAQAIVDCLPINSKRRSHCFAGISKAFLKKDLSSAILIAEFIRGPKLKCDVLREFIEYYKWWIIPGFDSKEMLECFSEILKAIPLEKIKQAIVKDILDYYNSLLFEYEIIKQTLDALNLQLKNPIPLKSIEEYGIEALYKKHEMIYIKPNLNRPIPRMEEAIARSRRLLRGID